MSRCPETPVHWSEEFLREFVRTLGDVKVAAELCGHTARAVSKRAATHPEFRDRFLRARARVEMLRSVSTIRRERVRIATEHGEAVPAAMLEWHYHVSVQDRDDLTDSGVTG